jgi:hypothetical protein
MAVTEAVENGVLNVVSRRGMRNPDVESAVNIGNEFHYDQLNGRVGAGGPSQLQARFPDTEFFFRSRGNAGFDVEVTGGTMPWEYPGSTWTPGSILGDFKPNTPSGINFPLPPGVQRLPYNPATGNLI